MYVQVNVGRDIGSRPMSNRRWLDLVRAVRSALAISTGAGFVDTHRGHGQWTNNHGDTVTAESAHLSVYVPGRVSDDGLDVLRSALAALAGQYRQEAIALVVTDSELIGPAS